MAEIWNAIVEQGDSFPQEERMALNRARAFFQQQTFSGVAVDETGALQGLYILHPNNVGRCAPSWIIAFCFSEAVTIFPLYFRITDSFNPISFANLLAFMKGNASKNPLKS